ncbi:glycosyltransferase family 2 protein [Patescibacteria group bacterium]|nr:glycosyltransferase family 2 protein [Patescibacteria group bacterium]
MKKSLSVVVPVHNEEKAIENTINDLQTELDKLNLEYEIIVINDASTDKTKEILENIPNIKIINHTQNKGYGASLKNGIKNAKFDFILFFDADGQHKPIYIKEMIKYMDNFDMISGARIGYKGPIIRQPGKKVLQWLANYLSQQKIPDLNCGLRIVKKIEILKFTHLLCDGFSFSTTSSLLFLSEGLSVKYVPIRINKREGKSKVRPKHAFDTFIFILRVIVLTSPLRIFLPISILLFLISGTLLIQNIIYKNIGDITILLFISAILIFFFGLLADQISAIRKEIKNKNN